MSQFRKYFVAELKLKGIPSVPMIHRTKPSFADHDTNWEYFEVVEIAALEAVQKEIAELKKENSIWIRCNEWYQERFDEDEIKVIEKLTAALKVAEDALMAECICETVEGIEFLCDAHKALSEIQKIKKGLG